MVAEPGDETTWPHYQPDNLRFVQQIGDEYFIVQMKYRTGAFGECILTKNSFCVTKHRGVYDPTGVYSARINPRGWKTFQPFGPETYDAYAQFLELNQTISDPTEVWKTIQDRSAGKVIFLDESS